MSSLKSKQIFWMSMSLILATGHLTQESAIASGDTDFRFKVFPERELSCKVGVSCGLGFQVQNFRKDRWLMVFDVNFLPHEPNPKCNNLLPTPDPKVLKYCNEYLALQAQRWRNLEAKNLLTTLVVAPNSSKEEKFRTEETGLVQFKANIGAVKSSPYSETLQVTLYWYDNDPSSQTKPGQAVSLPINEKSSLIISVHQ